MRRRCETCEYFKYIESNVYGRCQCKAGNSVQEGIPRVPWATACEFYQVKKKLNKEIPNRDYKYLQNTIQKQIRLSNDTAAYSSSEVSQTIRNNGLSL